MDDRVLLQQALEALEEAHPKPYNESVISHVEAITALRTAIEAAEKQEPVAWTPITEPYPPGGELDILMGDGSVLCVVLPQADGDLWWGGSGTGEKFIDPQYANVTHWRVHSDATPPAAPVQEPDKHLQLALEALAPLEKLLVQADEQGLLNGANVDCQIATIELRKSAYAASDIRAYLNTTPPAAQRQPLTDERVWELAANCLDSVAGRLQFARAIEAAHGIGENK